MGRPAGSKNGAKRAAATGETTERTAGRKQAASEAPEPAKPNSNAPSPEETAAFLSELTKLKTAAQSIAGDIAALGGRVKARGGPAYWKSIKRVHDLKKMDPDEARAELEALVQVAAQQDIRIAWMGSQATFADIMEQNEPPAKNLKGTRDLAAARAHADGFNSGKNGAVPHDNPFSHIPGSEEYVSWHNGRDEGALAREGKRPAETERVKAAMFADSTLPSDGLTEAVAKEAADAPVF